MAEARSFLCPTCASEIHVDPGMVQGIIACWRCGTHVSIFPRQDFDGSKANDEPGADAFAARYTITATSATDPWDKGPAADADYPDIRIKTAAPGDALAVSALVLPLVAECLLILSNFQSLPINLAIWWTPVFITAIMLSVDAYYLGPIDLRGQRRDGIPGLFLGMVFLWIIFYPIAYFRRRHFGRSNLGPLAIVVALIFAISPFAKEHFARPQGMPMPFGGQPALDDGPPACDSPDVKFLLEDMIRKGPIGPTVKEVGKFREVKFDRAAKIRRGRCAVRTDRETITIAFEVSWIDPVRRSFQVRTIQPENDPRGYFGIEMARPDGARPAGIKNDEGGVLIRNVVPNEAAERAGIKPGDVIVRINQKTFNRADPVSELREFVIDLVPASEVTVEILRNGERQQLKLTVGTRPVHLP